MVESAEEASHDLFDFFLVELSLSFLYLLEERVSEQQFQHHIDGILGLEYCLKFENVGMGFMIKLPHYINFVDEACLSVFGVIRILFGKGLDCKMLMISQSFGLVDGGEVSLTQFSDGPEHVVEAKLVDFLGKHQDPLQNDWFARV